MEQLATDFKSIENSIARYIFKKYIMPKPNNIENNGLGFFSLFIPT